MRIGLYGLPTAGKSFILNAVRNFEVLSGSSLLREITSDFHSLSESGKETVRRQLADTLAGKDRFIMDGHYSFGDDIVFTESDGRLYDVFLYLYVRPDILRSRMEDSVRNRKYLIYDIEQWQESEIIALRQYCHENEKDFYVLDNPEKGYFPDISMVLEFIDSIACGFSCAKYARRCADSILKKFSSGSITLADGDRTLSEEDSSQVLGYRTHLFDGNFYTGFQSWRHFREMSDYLRLIEYSMADAERSPLTPNRRVLDRITGPTVILTTGYYQAWKKMADNLGMQVYHGEMMSADTKYFITKFLQEAGLHVTAYGDSMNDLYMLRQANAGYLVKKPDGSLSRSLKDAKTEGLAYV